MNSVGPRIVITAEFDQLPDPRVLTSDAPIDEQQNMGLEAVEAVEPLEILN